MNLTSIVKRLVIGSFRSKVFRFRRNLSRGIGSVFSISTVFQIIFAEFLFIFLFVLATNSEGLSRVLSKENASLPDYLGLLPNPVILAVLIVIIAVLVILSKATQYVSRDRRYGGY